MMEVSWKRGRGSASNLKNRFERIEIAEDSEIEQTDERHHPDTLFLKDNSKSVIAQNNSPDIGFRFSLNPYRGCEHGCAYCYARPTHEYLGFSAGLDFETRIMVKENAPELLRRELLKKSYKSDLIAISGVTDAYQPVERRLKLTRQCLEVLAEFKNPVIIITKNALVTRDKDLLGQLAGFEAAMVLISITTLDNGLVAKLEPRTSRPAARLEAIRELSRAGIPVGVNVAPVIPGLNDHEIPQILKAAREAGAEHAAYTMLRLPFGVKDLFQQWLKEHFPDRAEKVLNRVKSFRKGDLNDSAFGRRMSGEGPLAEQVSRLFHLFHKRLGFRPCPDLSVSSFRRVEDQGRLF